MPRMKPAKPPERSAAVAVAPFMTGIWLSITTSENGGRPSACLSITFSSASRPLVAITTVTSSLRRRMPIVRWRSLSS